VSAFARRGRGQVEKDEIGSVLRWPGVVGEDEVAIFAQRTGRVSAELVEVIRRLRRPCCRLIRLLASTIVAEELEDRSLGVLLPDLVTTLMTAPPARPYSAEYAFEFTWNSFTAAALNWYGARPDPVRPTVWPRTCCCRRAVHHSCSASALPAKLMSPDRTSRDARREQREVDEVRPVDRQVANGLLATVELTCERVRFEHRVRRSRSPTRRRRRRASPIRM